MDTANRYSVLSDRHTCIFYDIDKIYYDHDNCSDGFLSCHDSDVFHTSDQCCNIFSPDDISCDHDYGFDDLQCVNDIFHNIMHRNDDHDMSHDSNDSVFERHNVSQNSLLLNHECDLEGNMYGSYSVESQNDTNESCAFPELHSFREKHSKNFIFGHLNINWFHTKFQEIHDILSKGLLDLFAISETKLNPSIKSEVFKFYLQDFSMYRQDRPGAVAGGGILCYINSAIPHTPRYDLGFNQDGIESMVFEVVIKRQRIFFIIIYRPPSVSVTNLIYAIDYICLRCQALSQTLYLMGDLNVDFQCENNPLINVMNDYSLRNIISGPTCFKNIERPTLNDVILTNCPKRILCTLNINTGMSDHLNHIQAATRLFAPKGTNREIVYRTYKRFNEDLFLEDLRNTMSNIDFIGDVNEKCELHSRLFSEVIDRHAPQKKRKLRPNMLPFMNGTLRKAINVKGMLRRRYLRFKTDENKKLAASQSNLVTQLKRDAMKSYLQKNCNTTANETKNQSKRFWETVRPFLSDNGKAKESIILRENEQVIVKDENICNIFNDYFVNIASDLAESGVDVHGPLDDIIDIYNDHPSIAEIKKRNTNYDDVHFIFDTVSSNTMHRKIMQMNTKKACGYDGISAKLVKIGAPVLSESLTSLYNMSVNCNVYPSNLKHAEISPLFKKEDKLDKTKYRPVNVLVAMSKLFEGLMMDQLTIYMSQRLSDLLSAYRSGYSTQHVLLRAIEDWKNALDRGEHVGVVAMDLSKAFDSIPHGLLLAKLYAYGLSKEACELIRSYLTDRKQRVKVNSSRSDWQVMIRGIPQGSIAGPVIFNIFINDLFYVLEDLCSLYNYADDNKLAYWDKCMNVIKMNLELATSAAIKWFKENNMKANAAKFHVLFITRDKSLPELELYIDGATLQSEPYIKLLGIYIDSELNFHHHVMEICKKAGSQVRAMARLSGMLDFDSKYLIFNAFIISNFMYCPLVWHMCGTGDTKALEKVQKRALCYVLDDFNDTYENLLTRASRCTLYLSRLRFLVTEIYKCMNDLSPSYMKHIFIMKETSHGLRDKSLLKLPKYNTVTYGFKTIRYQGSKLWNGLSYDMKCSCSLVSFKSSIQKWSGPQCKCGYCLQCSLIRI